MEEVKRTILFDEESGNFKLSELNAALALADFEDLKKFQGEMKLIVYMLRMSNQHIFII